MEQVADKGLFVICIRSVHLINESFVSVFYLIISASPSRVLNFQDGVACYFLVLSHGLALFVACSRLRDSDEKSFSKKEMRKTHGDWGETGRRSLYASCSGISAPDIPSDWSIVSVNIIT